MKQEDIKKVVRVRYGDIAAKGGTCCSPEASCCGSQNTAERIGMSVGYSPQDLQEVPEGANLGLGCGNPVALASLREGETVIDLGSGAGFDCFLAAKRVGPDGRVIGVDMTPPMLDKARENTRKGNYGNVEFRLGEIENLPIADNTADIIISNCVINLSLDKTRVFAEAFRALKPGGRIMVSDIVLPGELPETLKNSLAAYCGCVAGALPEKEYMETIRGAGFREVMIIQQNLYSIKELIACFPDIPIDDDPDKLFATQVASITVSAIKERETETR
jgi:SAM-dependent methyltransferase